MAIKDVIDNLSQHWDTAWGQERVGPANKKRNEELHPSSFPYCGYRDAMEKLEWGESETFAMGAMMSYYVNVGTTAHLVFQDFMGQLGKKHEVAGRIVGDWKCLDSACGHLVEFSTYKRCPKCKGGTMYEELGVRYRKRTEGHVDGLYKLHGKYYVLDYKTSSVRAVDHFRRTRKGYPYSSNKFQIRSYAAYLEQQYGIEIEGWVLIYAARDNPKTHYAMCGGELDENDRKWINRYVKVSDEMFDIVRNKVMTNTIDEKDIDNLCKYKLCTSQEFYNTQVHDQYNPCPYVGKCFSRAEHFLKRQIKVHNEN